MEKEDPRTCVFSPSGLAVRRVVGESVAGLFVQQLEAATTQALPPDSDHSRIHNTGRVQESEVSTASQLCDGALILVDVAEGVWTQVGVPLMTKLLMREAVGSHSSHLETGFVDQSSLLRPVVPLDQENLPPESGRKDSARPSELSSSSVRKSGCPAVISTGFPGRVGR